MVVEVTKQITLLALKEVIGNIYVFNFYHALM
jgi:hypothetical protein